MGVSVSAHDQSLESPSSNDPDRGSEHPAYADEEEVCVLLRRMDTSVRGFLALVRREAEAGW